jgi:hypothetical protein
MSKRTSSNPALILLSMLGVWWTLLVLAVVSGHSAAWFLVKWSPVVLVPWGAWDITRTTCRR